MICPLISREVTIITFTARPKDEGCLCGYFYFLGFSMARTRRTHVAVALRLSSMVLFSPRISCFWKADALATPSHRLQTAHFIQRVRSSANVMIKQHSFFYGCRLVHRSRIN
jgi:hypothetical protein